MLKRTTTEPTLITPREARKILTWVSAEGLRKGWAGTEGLTRYHAGEVTLYSREECEELKARIVARGEKYSAQRPLPASLRVV